ncbi:MULTISPECIES: hypothetical protein [Streptomyces]|uniref:hypothetical protein n=1 Tax=Streptomyces TaxID=1883 RepID=UPI0035AC0205
MFTINTLIERPLPPAAVPPAPAQPVATIAMPVKMAAAHSGFDLNLITGPP